MVAKYVCLPDLLKASGLPHELLAATAALAVKTDWSACMRGISLRRACKIVSESKDSLEPYDATTLEKVDCLST